MTKTINEKNATNNSQIFLEYLLKNAFDFLETGINQFETQPKYSVINFCSGIELVLKARLLHEHWSLIVQGEPDLKSFKTGNFKSTNFKNLILKINNVTNDNISINVKKCFDNLSDHRNKIMHFFHEANIPNSPKEIRKEIALEQHNAWIFLKELFNKWSFIFATYDKRILTLDVLMRDQKRQSYLKEKFEEIKDKIEEEIKLGKAFKICDSCGYLSSKETKLTEVLFEYRCMVCERTEPQIKLPCPCGQLFEINDYAISNSSFNCDYCDIEITKDSIVQELDTYSTDPKDLYDRDVINCAYCSSKDSVINHENYYVCTECLSFSENVEYCEWCGEGQLGEHLECSFYDGCSFCDGRKGWKDD